MERNPQNHMGPAATVTRRLFLAGAAAGTAGLLVERMPGAWAAPARATDDPFTLGVASGDPTRPGWCYGPGWRRGHWSLTAACRAGPSRSSGRWPPGRGWATWSAVARRWPIPASPTACTSRSAGSTRAAPTGTGSGPAAT